MKIFIVFLIVLLSAVVLAQEDFCIDFDKPGKPQEIGLFRVDDGVRIEWSVAADVPDCGKINHYNIYVNGKYVGETENLFFLTGYVENAVYGAGAVDSVGLEGEPATISFFNGDNGGNGGNGGGGGGGGGRSIGAEDNGLNDFPLSSGCVENWQCDDWGECIEGIRERACRDLNNCGTFALKLAENEVCESIEETSESNGFFSRITGAVIGPGGRPTMFGILLFLILVIAAYLLAGHFIKKKRR